MDQIGGSAAGQGPPAPEAGLSGLLELLVTNTVDYAIFALDPDGNVATWNLGAERVKGYRADEIVGRHFSCFYPGEDVAAGKPDRELSIALADGHHEDEGWRVRQDGTLFWADVVITALRGADGRLVGFGKVTRDLTERKRGDDAIRDSEERFRLLVSSVADYAIYLLDESGHVSSWNLGAERLKGYRADEIIGRHFSEFYTSEDRRAGVPTAGLDHARATGRWEAEGWRVRRDGSTFWANVIITTLRGADGGHRGFAKVTRDLTDRKRAEDALRGILERERGAADQLRELDRMRSDLVSTVAHDLRAPIGVLQTLLHLLRSDWGSSTEQEKLALIDRTIERSRIMAALADDVFDLVRIDAGHLSIDRVPIDVSRITDDVVADARVEHPSASIATAVEPGAVALGDERRTWQVIENLLSNAVKFSPTNAQIEVCVARAGPNITVAVSDQGPGIAADEQAAIFERFGRLPGAAGTPGSGLGLFIARSLAEAQGGRVMVESEPGSGATFRLELPADERASRR